VTRPSILQATAWYPPHLGGIEVYLHGLVAELANLGIVSTVLVPRNANAAESYIDSGIQVETYPVNLLPVPNEMCARKPHLDFDVFRAHLLKHKTAIYHQHAWTRGCGQNHLRGARELGLRTVLTVHVASNICMRGTMLSFGEASCDGRVEETTCGACWAHNQGAPKAIGQAIANLPLTVGNWARGRKSRLATALSARTLAIEKLKDIAEMIANADRIVAVCQWLYDVLAANGVPANKLVLNRHGVRSEDLKALRAFSGPGSGHDGPMRLLFLGRWDAMKGVDVVVRAIRQLPTETAVRLTICALSNPDDKSGYEVSVRALAKGDPRISIKSPVPRNQLAATFAAHDAMVIPSIGLETGPLVALEAQAAGLYILGSRRGGIAELVDENFGELVEAGDVAAWAKAITRLAARQRRGALPRPPCRVRTMATVAAEMTDLYRKL
jgi:glycosyltransferase involved in cell wall biosynthesis